MHQGAVVEPNLRRERLTVEDVAEEARLQGIANLDDVQWAVLETSGRTSFGRA